MAVSQHSEIYGAETAQPSWFKRREKAIAWITTLSGCLAFWGAVIWLVYIEL
jgi:hypothetical protein